MKETYVIHVTKKCNMNCLYCYEQDKSSEYTFDEIKINIDNIFNSLDEKVVIEFLGGEPMLSFDLIQQAFYYMEENYNNYINGYIITTNGTIINQEIIDFLKNNKKRIYFTISLDGDKFSNQLRLIGDYNSYDTVVDNVKKLLRNRCPVSIHMVTHNLNISWLESNIIHLYSLGIRNIGIGTVESTMEIDDSYWRIFKSEIRKVSSFAKSHNDLHIDLLDGLKPKNDVRTYYKDKDGKTVFEDYGRAKNDINLGNVKKYESSGGKASDKIYNIREYAYKYHQGDKIYLIKEINEKLIAIEAYLDKNGGFKNGY